MQQRRVRNIQSRLVLLLLFVLLPVLLIQAYIYFDRFNAERADELQANLEIARSVAKTFESFVQDVLHQELAIGLAITSSQPMALEDITRLLNIHLDYAAIRDFSWVTSEGTFLYSSNPSLIGAHNSDRAYFLDIASGREWTVGELVLARTTGKPVFGISRGIRDDKGVLLGIVVATVVPEKLDGVLSLERGKGGAIALIDNRGKLVYRHPAINLTWEERNWLRDYPRIGEVLAGKEVATTVYAPYEGKARLIGNTPVPSMGWVAGAGRGEEEVTVPILASLGRSALLFLSVSIAAFIFAVAVSRRLAGSVIALRSHVLSLGRGEQGEPVGINPVSEFQDLSEAFTIMAEKVRSREMELREQCEWLRVTLTSIGDAVVATDLEGRITFINPVASALTGRLEEEVHGRTFQEVLPLINELTRSPAEDIVERVLREGNLVSMANHTALVSRDGRKIPIEDSAAPIRDALGNLSGVVVVFHDVTDKRRALDALRESEEHFRLVFDKAPIGATIAGLDYRIRRINEAFCRITGYSREELIFMPFTDFTHPEDLEANLQEIQSALRGETDSFHVEKRYIRKSGEVIWVKVSGQVMRDKAGQPLYTISMIEDITDRKLAEEELRRAHDELEQRVLERTVELNKTMETLRAERQRFHSVLDVLPVYVALLTPDYQVPFANGVFRKRFGESRGLRCFEHLFGRSEPCEVCDTYRVLETMTPHQWEWTGPDSRNYDVFDFPFTDTDGSTLILEMGIDITERKQAEAELEKHRHHLEDLVRERTGQMEAANARLQVEIVERRQMEEKLRRAHDELETRVQERTAELRVSNKALMEYATKLERLNEELQEFAFVASHDLQEPLRKIQTFGHMLSKNFQDTLGTEGRDHLMRMTRAAKRMSELLQSLLNYSRVASRPNPFESVELEEVVRDAVSDLELSLRRAGGTVEIGQMPTIDADAVQMRQLFQNLIGNSIRYCRDCERPVIKVHGSTGGGICKLFVEDNGMGFEEKYVDRIFKPFQQLHGKSAGYGGTGMGLAICRKIVERHGGSITARSIPGAGSTFIMSLPVKHGNELEA